MCDPDFELRLDGFIGINLETVARLKLFRDADIIHIHSGIRLSQFSFSLIKLVCRAKWILHFHGSETRLGYGMHHQGVGDQEIVSTPDLMAWHPNAEWLPNPIPEIELAINDPRTFSDRPLTVGHFPSNRDIKGTDRILKALQPLISQGRLSLIVVENKPKADVVAALRKCDVVLDQLNDLNIFSKVALEAMALGVPTISSYDPSIFPSDCPVLQVKDESDVQQLLRGMIDTGIDDKLRNASRRYVERYHTPISVVRKLDEFYTS